MRKTTPTRPGPVAYISLALLYGTAFALFAYRSVTYLQGIALGRNGNFAVITAIVGTLCAACLLRGRLISRKASLLQKRLEDLEERAWWGEPKPSTDLQDTVDLSNVHALQRRQQTPEKRSS